MNSLFEKPQVLHPIQTLKDFFVSWKWACQRVRKGYCDRDLYSVSDWFIKMLPDMIEEIKKNKHGVPTSIFDEAIEEFGLNPKEYWNVSHEAHYDIHTQIEACAMNKWETILARLTFLLREAKEETCSKENPFAEQYNLIRKEFKRKYGEWGEKLQTAEEKDAAKRVGNHRVYFPADLPEYQEICECYFREEQKLYDYREKCVKEALELFSKWFYSLAI